MPPVRSLLTDTALAASGGDVVLTLDADSARPGHAHATVLAGERVVHVALDMSLGTVAVGPAVALRPTAPPSRRSVLAHH